MEQVPNIIAKRAEEVSSNWFAQPQAPGLESSNEFNRLTKARTEWGAREVIPGIGDDNGGKFGKGANNAS